MSDSNSGAITSSPDVLAKQMMQRAHLSDGLPEILVGLTFLLVTGDFLARASLAEGSMGMKALDWVFPVLLMTLCIGAGPGIPWIRRRYLIAKVGYVECRANRRRLARLALVTLLVICSFAIAAAFVFPRLSPEFYLFPERWLLAVLGATLGGFLVVVGRHPRLLTITGVSAVLGVALALSGISLDRGMALFFGVLGAWSLIAGSMVFVRLLLQPVEPGE
jgi:hypothetical protein